MCGQYFSVLPFSKISQKSKFLCKIFFFFSYKTLEVTMMLTKTKNICGSHVASGLGIPLSKIPWRCSPLWERPHIRSPPPPGESATPIHSFFLVPGFSFFLVPQALGIWRWENEREQRKQRSNIEDKPHFWWNRMPQSVGLRALRTQPRATSDAQSLPDDFFQVTWNLFSSFRRAKACQRVTALKDTL